MKKALFLFLIICLSNDLYSQVKSVGLKTYYYGDPNFNQNLDSLGKIYFYSFINELKIDTNNVEVINKRSDIIEYTKSENLYSKHYIYISLLRSDTNLMKKYYENKIGGVKKQKKKLIIRFSKNDERYDYPISTIAIHLID